MCFLVKKHIPCSFFWHIACSDIHTTIYSRAHTFFCQNYEKCWSWLVTFFFFFFFFFNAGGEIVKIHRALLLHKKWYVHILNLYCSCLSGDHRKTKVLLLLRSWKATSSQRTLTLPWTRRRTCWSRTWLSPWSFLKGWRRPRSSMAGEGFVVVFYVELGMLTAGVVGNSVKRLQFLMFNEKRCRSNLAL